MDLLDIVFRLERRFDIKITREELFQAFPGAANREFQARRLLDLVISKLPGEVTKDTDAVAGELDPEFIDAAWDWLHSQFPSQAPTDSVPRFTRKMWREFERQGVRPPHLSYGIWHTGASMLQLLGGLVSLAVYAVLSLFIAETLRTWGWSGEAVLWGPMIALFLPFLLLLGVVLLGVEWLLNTQPTVKTMDELARQLAEHNVRFFAKRAGMKLKRDRVWKIIRRELSDALAIDEEQIHPESDLVKDLQMD